MQRGHGGGGAVLTASATAMVPQTVPSTATSDGLPSDSAARRAESTDAGTARPCPIQCGRPTSPDGLPPFR